MATGKIIPSIRYKNCPEAIDWLARAFSFTSHFVVPGDQGEILHAQLTCGDAMIMLGSAHDGDDFGKLHACPNELEGKNTAVPRSSLMFGMKTTVAVVTPAKI
jgi:uncharacterized glyoxalase superfamily protein PhnB